MVWIWQRSGRKINEKLGRKLRESKMMFWMEAIIVKKSEEQMGQLIEDRNEDCGESKREKEGKRLII